MSVIYGFGTHFKHLPQTAGIKPAARHSAGIMPPPRRTAGIMPPAREPDLDVYLDWPACVAKFASDLVTHCSPGFVRQTEIGLARRTAAFLDRFE